MKKPLKQRQQQQQQQQQQQHLWNILLHPDFKNTIRKAYWFMVWRPVPPPVAVVAQAHIASGQHITARGKDMAQLVEFTWVEA